MPQQPSPADAGHITLTAAGDLRDALTAHARGDIPAAVYGLLAIDPDSWHAIQTRLADLGGTLPELVNSIRPEDTP